LRRRGHSKEGRDNDPQVVIALAVTRDGVPVRSWVFPGATPDVTTVRTIKDELRAMRLGRVLFVGDAGLYSKANLDELAKGAGRYVLAAPIGRVKEIRDEVLAHPGRYADVTPSLRAKEVVLGEGERRRRYVLCLNEEEADRQRRRRAEVLGLLEAELASLKADHPKAACRLIASRRFGPYLSEDDDGRPYLDRAKVRRAEQLDGKFVLTTNDDTLSVADVALGYKGMWVIESCFRKMKTTGLEVRPMFHWMPHRITAHVKLCVLALMIQRAAEIATGLPWGRLAGMLERLKAVRYTSEGRTFVQATTVSPELAEVLEKLDVPAPKTILAVG
jgi:transposase